MISNDRHDIDCDVCGENYSIFNEKATHHIIITVDGDQIVDKDICSRCLDTFDKAISDKFKELFGYDVFKGVTKDVQND